jgi:Na+/phosphate symporter
MSLIVNDTEFDQEVQAIENSVEHILSVCTRLEGIVDNIKENGIVDKLIDNKLENKINNISKYTAEVSEILASSRSNVEEFLSEIDNIDNLLR